MNKQYLLIGASAAGIGCALRLRMLDADAEITVLTAERDLPYNKCHLADVLLGEKPLDGLTLCSAELLAQKRITLVRDAQVMDIDHVQKIVHCKGNNESFSYDSLCLATGKSPRMLPLFEGLNFTNLFTFYYKSDLEAVITYVNRCQPRTAVVIGGGLTGLEAADGLRARGLAVTIVEAAPQVLPSLITEDASQLIISTIEDAGGTVVTGQMVHGYETKEDKITHLHLQDGRSLAADLVVCAVGATPNTSFLPEALQRSQGYCLVDEFMQTSMQDIYAAGDCCMIYDQLAKRLQPNALWPDAMQQGGCAAYGMVGITKPYAGSVNIASSSFFGIKVAIAGPLVITPQQQVKALSGDGPVHRSFSEGGWMHRLVYEQEKLVGFMLIGNTSQLSDYRRQLLTR